MPDFKTHFQRLKRHYERSIKEYDYISFLDLAHTLRVWTELKNDVEKEIKNFGLKTNFQVGIMPSNLKKIIGLSNYIYTYLPDGITTNATATKEIDTRQIAHGPNPNNKSFAASVLFELDANKNMTISEFLIFYGKPSHDENVKLNDISKNIPIRKVSFLKYMSAPAARFRITNENNESFSSHISNENLIERIANEYDASHAKDVKTDFELNNIFSAPVKELMQYGCASLPLPYFILLHVAKNILDNFQKAFG